MIKYLSGVREQCDYEKMRGMLLYENVENEEYPNHWHPAIEIIMPLTGMYFPSTLLLFSNAWLIRQGVMASLPAGETAAGISIGIIAVVLISFLQYFWVLAARFDADLRQTVKNAFLLDLAFFRGHYVFW